jgi:hypothetical protein
MAPVAASSNEKDPGRRRLPDSFATATTTILSPLHRPLHSAGPPYTTGRLLVHPPRPRPRHLQQHRCGSNASRHQNWPSSPPRVVVTRPHPRPRLLLDFDLDKARRGRPPTPPLSRQETTIRIRPLRCSFVRSRNNCSKCRSRSRLFSFRPLLLLLLQGGAAFLLPPLRQEMEGAAAEAVGSAYHLRPTSHRLDHPQHSLAKILAPSGDPEQKEEGEGEGEEGAGTCSISEPKRTKRTNSPPPSSCDRCNTLLRRRRRYRHLDLDKSLLARVLWDRASPVLAAVTAVPIVIIMAMQDSPETTRTREPHTRIRERSRV